MILNVSKISDLPPLMLDQFRKRGWTDDEILENLSDAVDFLNSRLHAELDDFDIPITAIFDET